MTSSMVEGLKQIQSDRSTEVAGDRGRLTTAEEGEPDLDGPAVAKPISHGQVLQLWTALKEDAKARGSADTFTLESLLVGAQVYVPPPPPKPEPSDEYKALMARLRREEEARAYERMVRPPDPYAASTFAQVHRPAHAADIGGDEVTLSDVNRQVMLILNFVLTMAGVAYALWVLARWWPTPSRLFLAMGGSILVGLAEYGLYAGYVWHLAEAAKKDKTPREVREVVKTWVVGAGIDAPDDDGKAEDGKVTLIPQGPGRASKEDSNIRRRKKESAS